MCIDGDGQHCPEFIPSLVEALDKYHMVVAARTLEGQASLPRALANWFYNRFASYITGFPIKDLTSGFRAISREAALGLFVTNEFTYTLETIIQAGTSKMKLMAVPVRTNPPIRKSRLFGSIPVYLRRSLGTIIRIYTMYHPLKSFLIIATLFLLGGLAAGGRFLYYYFTTEGATGHVQSLILAAILILAAFQTALSGFVADLIGANRKMIESVLRRVRTLEARETDRSAEQDS